MTNFVLVHGAWHGGWCWKRVAQRLRAAGHGVFAPTLSGLGGRRHLAAPGIGLHTHIADVVGLMEEEELAGAVLCGHSYGGMVITGAAQAVVGRIAALVYLDAFIPKDGDSLESIVGVDNFRKRREIAEKHGEGWWLPAPKAEIWGVESADDRAWIERHLTPQPLATFTETVRHTDPLARIPTLVYVHSEGNSPSPFDACAEATSRDAAWRNHAVPCGHEVMVEMPDRLAEILLEAAG